MYIEVQNTNIKHKNQKFTSLVDNYKEVTQLAQVQYYGTGRRKKSTARVRLVPGTGKVTINGRDSKDYFPYQTQLLILNQPLAATETEGTYDVLVNVHGGGFTGQA